MQLATRGGGKRVTGPYNFEEETNAEFCFPTMPGRGRSVAASVPVPLSAQLASSSRDGRIALSIVSQPEQQHRARYQTEGSRGAVKDRTGNGFPIVKVNYFLCLRFCYYVDFCCLAYGLSQAEHFTNFRWD